ncbi:MAG: hypothetical protein H6713_37760 [Myxococcales bacterium]|nr:hypothetical protein [Myxococcales bacterium]
MSASVSATPTSAKGSASAPPKPSSPMKDMKSMTGTSGPDITHATASGATSENASADWAMRCSTRSRAKAVGHRNTSVAPAVIPSMASAMTKNAR